MSEKTVAVDLRMPRELLGDLRRRVAGTPVKLDHYINAILMVQLVSMIQAGREEERRWNEYQRRKAARFPFGFAGIPPPVPQSETS